MSADSWDPAQYDRFARERRQPFFDLLSLLAPTPGGRVIDLGCGTGELTLALHDHLQAGETLGIDRSAAMLSESGRLAGGGVSFAERDIATFPNPDGSDGEFDVIAANASLHWLDDQVGLLRRLATALRPGGQLAFQVPANFDHVSHVVAASVAQEEPFAAALDAGPEVHQPAVLPPEEYAGILFQLGFCEQSVRLQVYGHVLESSEDVVEWVKGAMLTRYRERLDGPMYEEFVERYRTRLLEALGDQHPYFYPFKRILCWGRVN
jgi:trans-aconitate 2-methyltransferase